VYYSINSQSAYFSILFQIEKIEKILPMSFKLNTKRCNGPVPIILKALSDKELNCCKHALFKREY
jgi:hypothetical protein